MYPKWQYWVMGVAFVSPAIVAVIAIAVLTLGLAPGMEWFYGLALATAIVADGVVLSMVLVDRIFRAALLEHKTVFTIIVALVVAFVSVILLLPAYAQSISPEGRWTLLEGKPVIQVSGGQGSMDPEVFIDLSYQP